MKRLIIIILGLSFVASSCNQRPAAINPTPAPVVSGSIETPISDSAEPKPGIEVPKETKTTNSVKPTPSPTTSSFKLADLVVPKTEAEQDSQIDQNTLKNVEQDFKINDHDKRIGNLENIVNNPVPTPTPTPTPVPQPTSPPPARTPSIDDLTFDHFTYTVNPTPVPRSSLATVTLKLVSKTGLPWNGRVVVDHDSQNVGRIWDATSNGEITLTYTSPTLYNTLRVYVYDPAPDALINPLRKDISVPSIFEGQIYFDDSL